MGGRLDEKRVGRMRRTDRLFELIQLLRQEDGPVTSYDLAQELEVSQRTVYRDIATLQAMRVPIEGEAGVGYVLSDGYDLPPLNFGPEEIEAIVVGLNLLSRTGDKSLERAAKRVLAKIEAAKAAEDAFGASDWGIVDVDPKTMDLLRQALRQERKVAMTYTDLDGISTERVICPLSIVYYIKVAVLGAWCELRSDFRHFRIDRIGRCELAAESFEGEGSRLRLALRAAEGP